MTESKEEFPMRYGPWLIHSRAEVYSDPWVRVVKDQVTRPDEQPGTYTVVHIKQGVSVLPVDDAGFVYLTEEFHYAVGRETLEVVSGGIDEGEAPEQAAHRELAEELGILSNRLEHLGQVDPFTASLLSPTQLYLAQELTMGEASPEGTELIRCVKMSFSEAFEKVMDGTISHAPSCVLIMKANEHLR